MSDRILHAEPPLTADEKAARLDVSTSIKVESRYYRPSIRRDWERSSASGDAPYGYAERRTTERVDSTALEMHIPLGLDMPQLTRVIVDEIERQRAGLPKAPPFSLMSDPNSIDHKR